MFEMKKDEEVHAMKEHYLRKYYDPEEVKEFKKKEGWYVIPTSKCKELGCLECKRWS